MARRALGERRIGHTGTLDPTAEGLLLLCIGQATRLQQYLMRWEKTYQGRIQLGNATTTYDAEGEAMDPQGAPPAIDSELLGRLERRFSGTIEQIPPPYSAKKVAGKKLYELARSGQRPEVEPKTVTVGSLRFQLERDSTLAVEATTSKGFYVRTLAHDVGLEIGCGAYLRHLCRSSIGPYRIEDALPQLMLEEADDPQSIISSPAWTPIDRVRLPFPEICLNATATERFTHGQEVVVFRSTTEPLQTGNETVIRASDGKLLGIGIVQAVLARGRTISLRPTLVLQVTRQNTPCPSADDPTVATGGTS
jgi:tRNA pseudouridine55 synthase